MAKRRERLFYAHLSKMRRRKARCLRRLALSAQDVASWVDVVEGSNSLYCP